MILKRLRVANLRAFAREAEFNFQPGMNLIVGVNGVGKSTVLDALRIMLSRMLPDISSCGRDPQPLEEDDITVGRVFLSIMLTCSIGDRECEFAVNRPLEKYAADPTNDDQVRGRGQSTGQVSDWLRSPDDRAICLRNGQPFAVYYSPHRSVLAKKIGMAGSARRSDEAAYTNAFRPRELQSRELGAWLRGREEIAEESHGALRDQWESLNDTVRRFLGENYMLGTSGLKSEPVLRKDDVNLKLNQLSDGERGVLAMVLDLTRRLTQANPKLENPARDSEAIVLIDELDLHLHPKWQRSIVGNLTHCFPRCQFIATTHSPQIISAVAPNQMILLKSDGIEEPPHQSLGMDTNWVLRFIMQDEERDPAFKSRLQAIVDLIEREDYAVAQGKIDDLRREIGDFPELSRLQTRIDRLGWLEK